MFLRKKEEKLDDQLAVFQTRNTPRFASGAGISIEGFEGEGLVRNVSMTGCCMESVTYVAVKPDDIYQVRIIPDADEKKEPFTAKLVVTWIKSSETLFEAGFHVEADQIESSPIRRYAEALRDRGVPPDYGDMKQGVR